MKKLFFAVILFLSFSLIAIGNNPISDQEKPKVGEVLVVKENKGEKYNHIDFPRLNFLVKKGHKASYKSVYGVEVVVVEVLENKYGRVDVKLERTDGKKFFNYKKTVTANYEKALAKGELKQKS